MSRVLCPAPPPSAGPGAVFRSQKVTQGTCSSQRGCQCVNLSPLSKTAVQIRMQKRCNLSFI